ncbi:hypothetical protein [Caenimonas aquaedulcis]|uniref:DUF2029 domain-containing protein n=1 Tax=Caenimonas aquaedulcis TaxID=2793270 RepID=A0A931H5B5_9BURK|nr:hypothetical protein [Caenimonas aquaedulcis]MBG9388889.1 hypothetical protein [Caenimonas aquaedulcis]
MQRLRNFPPPSARLELAAILCIAWALFVAIPVSLGGIGLSWDALNHHIYLGWIAEHPRFDRDFLAASYQSFQYPYLYWPFYKLFQTGMPGTWAGAVLASINLAAVPPLWMLARRCVAEASWYGVAMRVLGVALAFLTGVVLSLFDSTANDVMASIPLVWAIALAMEPSAAPTGSVLAPARLPLLSGLFAGASVAFKLSNGPLAILMPLLWVLHGRSWPERGAHVVWGCVATLVGFLVFYGYWGWLLWTWYGDPVYPFYDYWFEGLRAWTGWRQP